MPIEAAICATRPHSHGASSRWPATRSFSIDERISARTRAAIESDVFGHVIDGERVAAGDGATLDIVDPATGDVIAAAAAGTLDDVDRAVRSARAAFEDGLWRDLPPMAKEKVLRNMAALVAERGELFGEVDVLDAGLLRTYTDRKSVV